MKFKITWKKVIMIIFVIFIFLTIIDLANYRTINQRGNVIIKELKIGMSVEDTVNYLQTNKKRLHINHWRYTGDENGPKWYPKENLFIHFYAPFSLFEFLTRGEAAWYILVEVDRKTGKVEKIMY